MSAGGFLKSLMVSSAVLLAACAGTTSVVNSEVKRDQITPLKNVVIITNLNLVLDADLFDSFSAQLTKELEKRGLTVTLMTVPAAESVAEKPDVKAMVAKTGADHVLSIFHGQGEEMIGGWTGEQRHLMQLDVIATVTDTKTHQRVWGTKLDHKLGGTLRAADVRAKGLLDAIMAEIGKTGMV